MPLFNAGKEYKDRYRSYTSESLIKIVTTDKEKHDQQTIDAAESLLKERGIDYRNIRPQQQRQQQQPAAPRILRVVNVPPATARTPKKGLGWRWVFIAIIIIRVVLGLLQLSRH